MEAIVHGRPLPSYPNGSGVPTAAQLNMASRRSLPISTHIIALRARHHAKKPYRHEHPEWNARFGPERITERLIRAMPVVAMLPGFRDEVLEAIQRAYERTGLQELHDEYKPGGPGFLRAKAHYHDTRKRKRE